MPVEIRELIIRAVVAEPARPAARADEGEDPEVEDSPAPYDDDRDSLIEECVRQVLRIIQQQKAR
ncbi:MAG: hypothetical protein HC822_12760 [Oscillochloris sp.]|nr:hypothetical protein [Oscillochloris sp.]